MTDQVDTDALPPEAEATPDEAFELGEVHGYDKGYADGLRAAADEIDRLQKELDKAVWDSREATNTAEYERRRTEKYEREIDRLRLSDSNATQQRDQLANALRRSDNENDRLLAVIEGAPHDWDAYSDTGCAARPGSNASCTCWKAAVL